MRKAAYLILVLAGCNASFLPGAACIDVDDVLEIPPGNALGTDLSGEYEIVGGFLKGCETCGANTARRDPCDGAFATVQEGATGTIVQDDGFLSIVDASGQELVGGIDADGTVILRTIGPVMDSRGEIVGRAFALFEGRFVGDTLLVDAIFRISTSEGTETSDYAITNEVVYERIE